MPNNCNIDSSIISICSRNALKMSRNLVKFPGSTAETPTEFHLVQRPLRAPGASGAKQLADPLSALACLGSWGNDADLTTQSRGAIRHQ